MKQAVDLFDATITLRTITGVPQHGGTIIEVHTVADTHIATIDTAATGGKL